MELVNLVTVDFFLRFIVSQGADVRLYMDDSRWLIFGSDPKRILHTSRRGSVAEWLACWTQAQKGPGSNRSRDALGQQS